MDFRVNFKYLIFLLFIFGSVAFGEDRKVTPNEFTMSEFDAVNHAEHLHRININDIEGLKSTLQNELAIDVKILWSLIQTAGISDQEKSRAYSALRLIAVQNEKYPNPALNSDKDVSRILSDALSKDPKKTAEVRARNWEKPWWKS